MMVVENYCYDDGNTMSRLINVQSAAYLTTMMPACEKYHYCISLLTHHVQHIDNNQASE